MAKKTGIGSYPADDGSESGKSQDANASGSKDGRKKREQVDDPDRIQKDFDRYRDEMAENAPASSSPEDNP